MLVAVLALALYFTPTAYSFGFFAFLLFRRLFVVTAQFHFAEDAFALHFLLENAQSLINIVDRSRLPARTRDVDFAGQGQSESHAGHSARMEKNDSRFAGTCRIKATRHDAFHDRRFRREYRFDDR